MTYQNHQAIVLIEVYCPYCGMVETENFSVSCPKTRNLLHTVPRECDRRRRSASKTRTTGSDEYAGDVAGL